MAKKDVVINIIAKVDDYEKRLKATGRFTEKQAAAMARKWERHLVDAQIKAGKQAQKSAGTAKIAWGSALGVLSADAIKNAARSLLSFTQDMADYRNEIADASVRTALAGETLAGLRLAAKGSGIEINSLEEAMLKLAQKGGDANENLDDFLVRLDSLETASEKSALAAKELGLRAGPKLMQALGGSGAALKDFIDFAERYGVDVGPQAAAASGRWQRLMGALDTQLKGTSDSLVAFNGAVDFTIDAMSAVGALSVLTAATVDTGIKTWDLYAHAIGQVGANIHLLTGQLTGNQQLIDSANARIQKFQELSESFDPAGNFTQFMDAGFTQLNDWSMAIRRVVDASTGADGGGGIQAIGKAAEQNIEPIQMNMAALDELFGHEERWLKQNAKLRDEIRTADWAKEEEWREKRMEAQEQERSTAVENASASLSLAAAVVDGVAAINEAADKKSAKARRRAAVLQRTAALFSIGINTAQAIMQALGAVPPPASFVLAAAAGVAGAVQAGIVASKPLPSFHTGGVVQADLLEGEGVLNQRAVQNIGRDAVESMNKGESVGGGPVQAMVMLNDRMLDRMVSRTLRADGMAGRMMGRSLATVTPYR